MRRWSLILFIASSFSFFLLQSSSAPLWIPLTAQLRLGKNATLQPLAMELPAFSGAIWDTSQWMDLHKEHVRRTNNGVEHLFSARVSTIIDKLKSSQDSLFDQVYIQSKHQNASVILVFTQTMKLMRTTNFNNDNNNNNNRHHNCYRYRSCTRAKSVRWLN